MSTVQTGDVVTFDGGKTGTVESIRTKRIRGVQTRQIFVKTPDGTLHMALSARKVSDHAG